MRRPVFALTFVSACLLPCAASAQGFPSKPLRMVVPFAAGGPADITARHVAPRLGELLGQTVVVDNRAGANGIIGVENVARSAPDGYSMLLATSSATAINMVVYSKLPFDVLRDLIPVSTVVTTGTLFLVHPALPVRTVKDLVALARKRPGEMAMGSSGSGSILHLALELVNIQAGTKITHVPYNGAGPAISDVMAGQINGMFVDLPVASPFVKAGKVRALAIASPERHALFPELPTMTESGFPEIAVRNWYGLFLAAKTPPDVVAKVHDALGKTLATREVRERLTSIGADPQLLSPEDFSRFVRTEIEKWGKVVRTAGIKIES